MSRLEQLAAVHYGGETAFAPALGRGVGEEGDAEGGNLGVAPESEMAGASPAIKISISAQISAAPGFGARG
jgi:hypothetical protein